MPGLLVAVVAASAARPVVAIRPAVADRGRAIGGGGRVARRVGVDLEDAKAEHAVRDLQAVVEPLEQVRLALEAVVAVVRLVSLADLVGESCARPRRRPGRACRCPRSPGARRPRPSPARRPRPRGRASVRVRSAGSQRRATIGDGQRRSRGEDARHQPHRKVGGRQIRWQSVGRAAAIAAAVIAGIVSLPALLGSDRPATRSPGRGPLAPARGTCPRGDSRPVRGTTDGTAALTEATEGAISVPPTAPSPPRHRRDRHRRRHHDPQASVVTTAPAPSPTYAPAPIYSPPPQPGEFRFER